MHSRIAMRNLGDDATQPAVVWPSCQSIFVNREHQPVLVHILQHASTTADDFNKVVADHLNKSDIFAALIPNARQSVTCLRLRR